MFTTTKQSFTMEKPTEIVAEAAEAVSEIEQMSPKEILKCVEKLFQAKEKFDEFLANTPYSKSPQTETRLQERKRIANLNSAIMEYFTITDLQEFYNNIKVILEFVDANQEFLEKHQIELDELKLDKLAQLKKQIHSLFFASRSSATPQQIIEGLQAALPILLFIQGQIGAQLDLLEKNTRFKQRLIKTGKILGCTIITTGCLIASYYAGKYFAIIQ